ncbi:hypothetical protein CU098_012854 [Rhizopus stolonifer]|uniref:Uncharacterized protein n=1 Tax=Rhizopus stolonifer TaxID=4846 RepID=A0A367KUT1_RHIST|nr:hypothetical protein CU098_012854 [Rhizopus stolonifer]
MCNCGCIKEVDKGDYVQAGWNSYLTQCNQTLLADLDAQFDKNCPKGEDLNTEDCEYFKNNVTGKLTDLWKHCGDVLDSVRDDCDNCGTNCTRIKPPGQSDD